jgi:hypothetical protein
MAKKWMAFLRLKGETQTKEKDMLNEFSGFVQSIRGVDVDCNVIVLIEGEAPRMYNPSGVVQGPETRGSQKRKRCLAHG